MTVPAASVKAVLIVPMIIRTVFGVNLTKRVFGTTGQFMTIVISLLSLLKPFAKMNKACVKLILKSLMSIEIWVLSQTKRSIISQSHLAL